VAQLFKYKRVVLANCLISWLTIVVLQRWLQTYLLNKPQDAPLSTTFTIDIATRLVSVLIKLELSLIL